MLEEPTLFRLVNEEEMAVKKEGRGSTLHMSFRIPDSLAEKLKSYHTRTGISKSAVIRKALELFLDAVEFAEQ